AAPSQRFCTSRCDVDPSAVRIGPDRVYRGGEVARRAPKKPVPPPAKPSGASGDPRRSHLEPPANYAFLDAVARHGSIRKAADAMHIASSALNRRILDLVGEG